MIGKYLRLPDETLNDLLENADALTSIIYPDEETEEWSARCLDIDKTWHIIHFLLNGAAWAGQPPLFNAVLGGAPISDEDVGYGPARFLIPSDVQAVTKALQALPAGKLFERWDQHAIDSASIYPQGWSKASEDIDYISSNYEQLRSFFATAAANGEAVIAWLG